MNLYRNYFFKYSVIIIIFFYQLYNYQNASTTYLNPLLIAYNYTIMSSCSITTLALIAILLDILAFIKFGLIGLNLLIIVPLSWILYRLKSYFYYPTILNICLIILFITTQSILEYSLVQKSFNGNYYIVAILINSIFFLCLKKITK